MSWIPRCIQAVSKERILDATQAVPFFADEAADGNLARTHCFVVCTTAMAKQAHLLHEAFARHMKVPTNIINKHNCNNANNSSTTPQILTIRHCFAAKANFLKAVLESAKLMNLGCEVASIGELIQALKVFPPSQVIYSSPTKTLQELKYATELDGLFLNLDNFEELTRVDAIVHDNIKQGRFLDKGGVNCTVGIRINPQLGVGAVGMLSTAQKTSKFGIGLEDQRETLLKVFCSRKYLKMIHVHTGSQGIGFKMMVEGVKSITDFAEEVNTRSNNLHKIEYIDIGGGLPVNFKSDEITPTFKMYADLLAEHVPVLFSGRYGLITEFGRSLIAKAGVFISLVEYVKENGGRRIVQQHVGADLAVRTIWQPEVWPVRVDLYNGETGENLMGENEADDGGQNKYIKEKENEKKYDIFPTDIAGPCCLGGDLIAVNRMLPKPVSGRDYVVIKDVGGYYHSAYSVYNARAMPPVYLYDDENGSLKLVQKGQSIHQLLSLFE